MSNLQLQSDPTQALAVLGRNYLYSDAHLAAHFPSKPSEIILAHGDCYRPSGPSIDSSGGSGGLGSSSVPDGIRPNGNSHETLREKLEALRDHDEALALDIMFEKVS